MLVLIDNYDSFTYNLVHFLGELGAACEVFRNDKISVAGVLKMKPKGIVLSPGPCTPNEAGICLRADREGGPDHPAARRVPRPPGHRPGLRRRGGARARSHARQAVQDHPHGQGPVQGPAQEFEVTRYHSLIVERKSLPDGLTVTAKTTDGLIMGLQHKTHPVHGVQFHPESIASEHGHALLANFLELAGMSPRRRNARPARHAA